MLKQMIAATGLCALALIATPAAAQDRRGDAPAPTAGFKDNVRTARELGSRGAVGRRRTEAPRASGFRGGVRVATGDVNGDGATSREPRPPRTNSGNNLKQIGLANH